MGQLARSAKDIPVIICHGHDADPALVQTWSDLGAVLLPCGARGAQLDPNEIMQQLGAHGLTRIFCEGGAALAASLLWSDLVDELVGFTAGVSLGAEGWPSLGAMGVEALADAPRYALADTQRIGDDVLHRWERRATQNGTHLQD